MPAKKAAQKSSSEGSNSGVWMWVYVVAVIVAGLLGAFGKMLGLPDMANSVITWILILAGILSAIFFLDHNEVMGFGVRVLLLGAAQAAFSAVPVVGAYLTGFFGGVYTFLLPVGLTLLVVYFWNRYFSSMM
jgi:hypothetical protein